MNETGINWLWNGNSFEPAQGLPFSDRGVRYGMAVFETLRIFNGLPDFWHEHISRIEFAASRSGLRLPSKAVEKAIEIFPIAERQGVLRFYVSAGDGAPAAPAISCRVALLFEPRIRQLPGSYGLVISHTPQAPIFGGLKTANYWSNAENLRQAHHKGAQESLVFNTQGALMGACMANVFVKIEGTWWTPSIETGARNGVVREWVRQRLDPAETAVGRESLKKAEAIFLTSSWLGIMPVDTLDGHLLRPAPPEIEDLRLEWNQRSPTPLTLRGTESAGAPQSPQSP